MHEALNQPASNYIDGLFKPIVGDALISRDPARPGRIVWQGKPSVAPVNEAVGAARSALESWSETTLEQRVEVLRRWQAVTREHAERIAGLITDEMGKTLAESRFEAGALAGKVDIALGAHSMARVANYEVEVDATRVGRCRFKPHGVMAVIGPFNFPAHLPNGHFVPAMLMGNTVVFKPSEKTPGVGQLLAELMDEAEVPPGVFNLVHGGPDVASALVNHDGLDGILFTGSWPVGRRILEANLDRPGRMIALELGGNNPAVIMPGANLRQAVLECVRAGFATTGQRCTCTRRIIVHEDIADVFIPAFCKAASTIMVGPGRSETPVFFGPLISDGAVNAALAFQADLPGRGGSVLVEAARLDREGHFITPGVIEVPRFELAHDGEIFAPIVQISRTASLEDAIGQANATRYGLAASIFTDRDHEADTFLHRVRSGCINRNTGTAGASSQLPFGGWGQSGNHRPAGSFSSEYCVAPVAAMIERGHDATVPEGVHWDDDWL